MVNSFKLSKHLTESSTRINSFYQNKTIMNIISGKV